MPGRTLNGKVAILTGAAGGIGRVLVHALLAEGAKVAALDLSEQGLAALRDGVPRTLRDRLLAHPTDISDYAACENSVAKAIATLGAIHVVINNGAIGLGAIRAITSGCRWRSTKSARRCGSGSWRPISPAPGT